MRRTLSRRTFLTWLSAGGATGLLAACGGQQAAAPKPTAAPTAASAPAAKLTEAVGNKPTQAAESKPAAAAPTTAPQPSPSAARIAPPANKREVIIAQGADITNLDPHLSTFGPDLNATFNLYDNLTFRGADSSKLDPMLATEWGTSSDTEWTFKLRPNVRWHNGDPFTSADVKFSVERTYDPNAKTTVATVFTTIERVDTPDDLTVVFKTKQPDPLLPSRLASYGGQMMPKRYFEQVGKDEFAAKPVGSGPYSFVEWVKDDRLVYAANKEYWNGAPSFERLVIVPRPETASRVAALQAGEADVVVNVPADQLERVNGGGKARIEGALFNGLHVLAVNSKVPPLDNPLVKQALSYAIDREAIIKSIWRSQAILPNGGISRGDFAYDEGVPPLGHDPARAMSLLREAGYTNEEIVIESTQGYMNNDRQMAEAIDEMWKTVGINSKLEIIEISVRAARNRDRNFKGLWWSDPASTLLDPDGMMWRLLGPGGAQDYWRHEEWDRLGNEARFSLDQELRRRHYTRMNEIFRDHLPWIPIHQPRQLYGVQNYMEFTPYGIGSLNFRRENLKLAGS